MAVTKLDHKISDELREKLKQYCQLTTKEQELIDSSFKLEDSNKHFPQGCQAYPVITVEEQLHQNVTFVYHWQLHIDDSDLEDALIAHDITMQMEKNQFVYALFHDDHNINIDPSLGISCVPDYQEAGRYYCLTDELGSLREAEIRAINATFDKAEKVKVIA